VKQRKNRVGECYLKTGEGSPICNLLYIVYKEGPLCSWGTWVPRVAASLLNKLASQKLWCPLCLWVLLQHFWGPACDLEGGVLSSLLPAQCLQPAGRAAPARHHWTVLIQGPRRRVPVAQRNLERLWNQPGSPAHQTGNSGLPQEAEGSLINSQRHTSNHLLGWNHVCQVQGAGWKHCAVWECVKLRTWDIAWLWSECGVPIHWSVMNSYGLW
jgi:hypothetical protein